LQESPGAKRTNMPHYYFDIETTGLDPEKDEIITIQFQKVLLENGKADEPLTILKSWEKGCNEEKIINEIAKLITLPNPWKFVPVGNNLHFEFKFLLSKIKMYTDIKIDPLYFHSRPHIDLKHVLILLNGGRFKGYHLYLNKLQSGASVPIWYQNKEYLKIIEYIKMEASAFTDFYTNIITHIFNHQVGRIIINRGVQNRNVT